MARIFPPGAFRLLCHRTGPSVNGRDGRDSLPARDWRYLVDFYLSLCYNAFQWWWAHFSSHWLPQAVVLGGTLQPRHSRDAHTACADRPCGYGPARHHLAGDLPRAQGTRESDRLSIIAASSEERRGSHELRERDR